MIEWNKKTLVRMGLGSCAGALVFFLLPSLMWTVPPYAPPHPLATLAVSVLLGAVVGLATLPFADGGRELVVRSLAHFVLTAGLFTLLLVLMDAFPPLGILTADLVLALLYGLVWLGRWIGWYQEVMQLRVLLGLSPGPSPLKWRETLPYLPFALLVCDALPLVFRWIDRTLVVDFPVFSGLLLPYLLLPVVCFCSGLSLGKRQGVCPVFPAALFLCYLPMVFLLYNYTALFHCFMAAVPAAVGNVLGWLYRRAVPKQAA